MAKVEITATALTRTGLMKNEDCREHILDVLGKNRPLFQELKDYAFPLKRATTWDRHELIVDLEQCKVRQNVYVTLFNARDLEVLGTATFGRTSFFKGLDTDEDDE